MKVQIAEIDSCVKTRSQVFQAQMPAPKRIVAFAYDNPMFDEQELGSKATGKKEDSPGRTTRLEVKRDPNERQGLEQDPEEVMEYCN